MATDEPCLVFAEGAEPATGVVRVTCQVGHGEADLPRQAVQAVVMLAKEWMDAGIALEAGAASGAQMSFMARSLMKQVRYARPAEFGCA